MSRFEENLERLPSVEHLERMELYGDEPEPEAVIYNAPGQRGSLAIYHAVSAERGAIDPVTARRALDLFAEKAKEARQHPGSHPNIDRLFTLIEEDRTLRVRAVAHA